MMLAAFGFRTTLDPRRWVTIDEVWSECQRWLGRRDDLPFEIDGVVIKVDSFRLQEEMGVVAREPRWATAYKFPAVQKTTVLDDITITVGRTGTLNPTAILQPVNIGGVTVRRASLRPVCGAVTKRDAGEAMRYCTNAACPAQLREQLHHFVSRGAMDINGMGAKLTDRFVDLGWVRDAADLYALDWDRVAELEGLGEKSAANLRAAIEEARQRPLARLLNGLGIRHIGERTAALLARRFGSIEALPGDAG
jgi:DNA ligase (NAD+)